MNMVMLNSQRFYSSFDILYPWYNNTTIVKYKYTKFKFFVFKTKEDSFKILPLNRPGRIRVHKKGRKNCTYVSIYRKVIEVVTGKPIQKNMEVHHIDHNHNNNFPENLVVVSHEDHVYLHRILKEGITDFVNGKGTQKLDSYIKIVEAKKDCYM